MGIQVNIILPVFVFLICFLALLESLKVFTFMMIIGIISLGWDKQHYQYQVHYLATEDLASELLKRVICRVIEGIKGEQYPPRNANIKKNKRNKQKHSKQHKLHQNWNWKINQSIVNPIHKPLQWNNRSSLQPSCRSTLPKSVLSNTPLSLNWNKIYKNTKKMSNNKNSGHTTSSLG